ncbi:MAG: hypothetical protein ACOCQG_03740 [Candidatus Nanoarchaeia archaeon]
MNIEKAIFEEGLTPFGNAKPSKPPTILKTRDAKKVYEKLRKKISSNFVFSATKNVLDCFEFPACRDEIKIRQELFKTSIENDFLKKLSQPKSVWRPEYSVTAVTEDEATYSFLKKKGIPVILLLSSHDLEELKDYDIVQAIDCHKFVIALESFGQVVFCKNPEDVYLERYMRVLSGWENNLRVLEKYMDVAKLKNLLEILKFQGVELTQEAAEKELEQINQRIGQKLESTTFGGRQVFEMLDSGELPEDIKNVIKGEIGVSFFPHEIFEEGLPVKLDYEELFRLIKEKESSIYFDFAEKLKKNKEELHKVPGMLRKLEVKILIQDFIAGLVKSCGDCFPTIGELEMNGCRNMTLTKPEPVSFYLDEENKCSILTGANSGGKTTLIEHIIQLIIMTQYGLPIYGEAKVPEIKEIYYFAKNKGKINQGAFEALLNQMASIKNAKNAIILADEIEAITEPGIAADIISATAEYFVSKGFYLVFATHLGRELINNLPEKTRIDGIEAKGLDEKFNLIIERSPVIGKLASSTPELIIQRLAQTKKDDYFRHLANKVIDGRK